jgi:hypothetical protein
MLTSNPLTSDLQAGLSGPQAFLQPSMKSDPIFWTDVMEERTRKDPKSANQSCEVEYSRSAFQYRPFDRCSVTQWNMHANDYPRAAVGRQALPLISTAKKLIPADI